MPGFQPEINSKLKNGSETVSLDYGLIFKIQAYFFARIGRLKCHKGHKV